jgi:hypothetical protein
MKHIQKLMMENRNVTPLSIEELQKLNDEGNLYKLENDGKVVAVAYKKPIGDNLYRVGGLSLSGNSKKEKVENLFKLIGQIKVEFLKEKFKLISKTSNPVAGSFFKQIGCEELTFEESKNKYPESLQAYLDNSKKPESYYHDKMFYFGNH